MKIEYKNIRGKLIKKDLPCYACCFYPTDCVPYPVRCDRRIFKEEKTQIFNL